VLVVGLLVLSALLQVHLLIAQVRILVTLTTVVGLLVVRVQLPVHLLIAPVRILVAPVVVLPGMVDMLLARSLIAQVRILIVVVVVLLGMVDMLLARSLIAPAHQPCLLVILLARPAMLPVRLLTAAALVVDLLAWEVDLYMGNSSIV
jgi:hypothetical protein